MAQIPPWADLPPELLCRIGDRLKLKEYASARGACPAWRCALAPPSPALLLVEADSLWLPYAASLPTRRSFGLTGVASGCRCVGSSNGWLALSFTPPKPSKRLPVFVLFNPIAGVDIVLPPLMYDSKWVSKVVFTRNPTMEDFAAAAICDIDKVAYVTAGARRWAVMEPLRLTSGDQLTDTHYTDGGKVYCLTKRGDVHLLRLPERPRRQKPTVADDAGPSEPEFSVLVTPKAYSLLLRLQLAFQDGNSGTCNHGVVSLPPESQGPDMNAPATIEPLLSEANLPFRLTDTLFDPARFNPTIFAPPYDTVSAFTSEKNLVFCQGSLYQVWRNTSCTVNAKLPGGDRCRIRENEIFVLRYYPQRQPCWDVVRDLGGYSFFVGRNNAASMYAEGVPGLRGNCVYWIGGRGRYQGMVFDMATGQSTSCQAPQIGPASGDMRTVCWYFLSDVVCNNGGRRV